MGSIDSALEAYGRAKEKAGVMPPGIDVMFIPDLRVRETLGQRAQLEARDKEKTAAEIYDRIMASLSPEGYENARRDIYSNREMLEKYLEQDKRESIRTLIDAFRDIDEGDRLSLEKPETARNLGQALRFYKRAEQKSKSLPPDIKIEFITELKINASLARKTLLEAKNREIRATEIYELILSSLKPLEWQEGRKLLYENRDLMEKSLNADGRDIIGKLTAFFKDIDEGDRLAGRKPETKQGLEEALALYSRAGEKADALSVSVDVRFISDGKIKEGLDRKGLIEIRDKKLLAREKYDQIISELKTRTMGGGQKTPYPEQTVHGRIPG